MPSTLVRCSIPLAVVVATAVLLPGCGGGGGGSQNTTPFDPVVELHGENGRMSRLPGEANADYGATPPPSLPKNVSTNNHWFRLEFPFPIDRKTILDPSSILAAYDYLNGNITVSDVDGNHVPGLALVKGIDAQGVNHSHDAGFPHDIQNGVDKNLAPNVFLYVANVDYDLSTLAAFGYLPDPLNPGKRIETTSSTLDTVRITVATINGFSFDAVWTFHIGTAADTRPPFIVRTAADVPNPLQPTNANAAGVTSSFIVEFSKPMVPHSVGSSAELDPAAGFTPYDGNMPRVGQAPPVPPCGLVATVTSAVGTLIVPFDCEPLNKNNLATYRLRPLIDLPGNANLDVLVRAAVTNVGINGAVRGPLDLAGNAFNGQDGDNDGNPDGTDFTHTYAIGPGSGVVNIPVSPEVMYWLPAIGDGIGAIDLNGHGYNTNTPGANAGVQSAASIITQLPFIDANYVLHHPTGLNAFSGIAVLGNPGNQGFPYNGYLYPVGTGGFAYGAGTTAGWRGLPTDTGNTGTPFPGINEMSSGFETLCRNSDGDAVLTGRTFGRVGNLQDLIVGDFLDVAYFDSESLKTNSLLHVTIFNSPRPHTPTARGNTIADPPTPNPPPLRYWTGLPSIGVVLDQVNPLESPLLIEGEEVFTGVRCRSLGFTQLIPNQARPDAPDETYFPHVNVGPAPQSATGTFTYSARQQLGNYLYATDATSGELHVLNSNTMRVIKSISLPDPSGLAISPDLKRVYVTNYRDDSVSVINSDPLGVSFHEEVARIHVGAGPRSIAVQPDNEDIFCCNYLGNTVSVISTVNLSVRKTLDALINLPYDVELTERQPIPQTRKQFGWACGIYFGYISNFGGNSVVVFESGPDGPQGIGIDGILGSLPTQNQTEVLIAPRGLCATPLPNPSGLVAGGVFVTHQDENGFGRVSQIQFTQQAQFGPLPILAPPGLTQPPGFLQRQFEVTSTWGNTDANRLIGTIPVDVCLADVATAAYHAKPSGTPNLGAFGNPTDPARSGSLNSKNHMRNAFQVWSPDRMYVAFSDVDAIQILDPTNGAVSLGSIPGGGTGGVKKLMSYWRE